MTWWQGTRLVAARAFMEQVGSRTFKVLAAILLLAAIAALTVPRLVGGGPTSYTLATVDEPPPDLRQALESAAETGDFTVEYVERGGAEAVRSAVREGDADAGLVGDQLYTSTETDAELPAVLSQVVVSLETADVMDQLELNPDQRSLLTSIRPPERVLVETEQEQARSGVAFVSGIVLYLALNFAGAAIATTVAVEKSSRISEVLLAVLRPSQILVGNVAALGAATLLQLSLLAVPLGVAVRVSDDLGIPPVAATDIGLAVVWFVLGFALYAFAFAATAALVDKVTEVSTAIFPVTLTLIVGYLVAIVVVAANPRSGWSTAASFFPATAPLAMPVRWATGDVPAYELALAMALTAATAVLVVWLASALYRRALVVTGRKLGPRDAMALLRDRSSSTRSPSR